MFQKLARQENAVQSSCRSIWPFFRRSVGVFHSLVHAASWLLLISTVFNNFYLKFQLEVNLVLGALLVPPLGQFAVRGYLVRAVCLVYVERVWYMGLFCYDELNVHVLTIRLLSWGNASRIAGLKKTCGRQVLEEPAQVTSGNINLTLWRTRKMRH